MRHIGVSSYGIRMPVVSRGDDLPIMTADALCAALEAEGLRLTAQDVVGITESVVAKAQGNYADISDIAADVRAKFGENPVGVVFPIMSRNRFLNILKGIAAGVNQLTVLLQYPQDEVGNPVMNLDRVDELADCAGPISAEEFTRLAGAYAHPFTGVDYLSLYGGVTENIYLSRDPRDILQFTPHVIAAEIHARERTRARLLAAGAKTVYTLADILREPVNNSGSSAPGGYNPDYGVLGSNLSTGTEIKLFPRDCDAFVEQTRAAIHARTGVAPEVLVYGDGAFKDPAAGIWELADPVVAPGHTARLSGQPNEIKFKFVADSLFGDTPVHEKTAAMTRVIRDKQVDGLYREGTTPRKYADLLGSLCDLMSGSGDKGTPLVLIQGYFDDYASE